MAQHGQHRSGLLVYESIDPQPGFDAEQPRRRWAVGHEQADRSSVLSHGPSSWPPPEFVWAHGGGGRACHAVAGQLPMVDGGESMCNLVLVESYILFC